MDYPAETGRESPYRLLQEIVQIELLHDLLRQQSWILDGLKQLYPLILIFPPELREMDRRSTPLLA